MLAILPSAGYGPVYIGSGLACEDASRILCWDDTRPSPNGIRTRVYRSMPMTRAVGAKIRMSERSVPVPVNRRHLPF
jgi:hypothetical protein